MRKNKKIKNKKILLIILIILCIVLSYIANIVSTNRNLTIFEKAIKDSILVVEKVLCYPIDFVSDIIEENKEKKKMYNDYELLKQKVEDTELYISENQELRKQINDLKEILNLNTTLTEYDMINATIIGRDLAYWGENIIIDKGEEDGVKINMPVVISQGLVGKVIKTSNFNSTIRLLTSSNNDKISVKINNDDNYTYGILSKYDSSQNIYIIEGIKNNVKIKENSLVTTTGMGDIFPAGIVIGKVVRVTTDNFDLSSILEISPNVDFDSLNYVTVLVRK